MGVENPARSRLAYRPQRMTGTGLSRKHVPGAVNSSDEGAKPVGNYEADGTLAFLRCVRTAT